MAVLNKWLCVFGGDQQLSSSSSSSRDTGTNPAMRRICVAWRWRALLLCASAIAAVEPALATDNVEVECGVWAFRQGKATLPASKWVEGQG